MSSKEISIGVEGIGKCYEIYAKPVDRLKQMMMPKLARTLGRSGQNYYKEFWALRGISFDVRRGETVGIVGRNGSGKSTLLQMICGTLHPTLGSINVNGRIAALLELGAGFNPEFTGRENVFLSGLLYGISEEELREKYDDILAFAQIGDFIDQPVKTYSSGMYVRLAFAVAINVAPDILVVDEALAVGDEAFQRKCFARIEAIRNDGATVLFVSHSAGTVIELCDRAILLDQGELLAEGTPKNIVTTYQKLLYAPAEKVALIRESIRSQAVSEKAKRVEADGAQDKPEEANPHLQNRLQNPTEEESLNSELSAYLDEGLISASAVAYENRGASIEDPHLRTKDGERVNVLVSGEQYSYTYMIRFDRALFNVRCGMMIRSITGVEIGGAASSLIQHAVTFAEAGSCLCAQFEFRCLLAPGTYFLSAGVLATIGEGEEYVDRRVDVVMFRVMPDANRIATGFVDLHVRPELTVVT